MAQLKELTSEEIVTLFKDPQTLFFFMKDKKKMHNGKYDAIGIKKQKNATAFLKKYFQKQPGEAENYMAAPITFRDVEYLQEFMVKCKIHDCVLSTWDCLRKRLCRKHNKLSI